MQTDQIIVGEETIERLADRVTRIDVVLSCPGGVAVGDCQIGDSEAIDSFRKSVESGRRIPVAVDLDERTRQRWARPSVVVSAARRVRQGVHWNRAHLPTLCIGSALANVEPGT